jgi:hypothetical protein
METANFSTERKPFAMGSDPEIFLKDKKLLRFTSAHDLIPGTKEKPHALVNGFVQVDGVAMEFNSKPAYTPIEFAQNHTALLQELKTLLPEHIEMEFAPSVVFDKMFFDSLPDDPKELGCNPDYNGFYNTVNPRPNPGRRNETMRTGSGHIHISWTENQDVNDISHRWDCNYIVKCLEHIVGPYLHIWDKDMNRSTLYGRPYALRYRTYGVEWRTPSNAWLRHPELYEWLFNVIKWTYEKAAAGGFAKADVDRHRDEFYHTSREDLNTRFVALYGSDFPVLPAIKGVSDTPSKWVDPYDDVIGSDFDDEDYFDEG